MKVLMATIALLATTSFTGTVDAQQSGPPQEPSGGWTGGYWMGPWMMGPNGTIGNHGMGPWMMWWNGQGASMCTMMTGHIEGRLAYLKTELGITDAQASVWNTYAGAARDNAQAMLAHCNAMMDRVGTHGPTLPDRLDQHEQLMAAQLETLRAMNKALKPLYAALSETQKQTADQLFWGPMGMMGMM
jgi:hypothetical protein